MTSIDVKGLVLAEQIGNVHVECWNYEDADFMDNDFEAVLATRVDVGEFEPLDVQDVFIGDGSFDKRDGFILVEGGCREVNLDE